MKAFNNPQIRIVLLNERELIATSGGDIEGSDIGGTIGPGQGFDARQRNPIWDDYE